MTLYCDTCSTLKLTFVSCSSCEFKACVECHIKYLMKNICVPKCMSCNVFWTKSYMLSQFPRSFVTDFFEIHQINVIMLKEFAMLPYTQTVADSIYDFNYLQKLVDDNKKQIQKGVTHSLRNKLISVNKKLKKRIEEYSYDISLHENVIHYTYVKCPSRNCRCFVKYLPTVTKYNNPPLKCNICNHSFCRLCHNEYKLDIQHSCSSSVTEEHFIRCPQCNLIVFTVDNYLKTHGQYANGYNILAIEIKRQFRKLRFNGSHVWCMYCNTEFDVQTKEVFNFHVKNPIIVSWEQIKGCICSYNEYKHDNIINFKNILKKDFKLHNAQVDFIFKIYNSLLHIDNQKNMKCYEWNSNMNEDERVKFLLKACNEEHFLKTIKERERRRVNTEDVSLILESTRVIGWCLWDKMSSSQSYDEFMNCFNELMEYIDYHNEMISKTPNKHFYISY